MDFDCMKITLTIKRLVLIAIILAISIETYSQKNIKGRIFEYTNETNLPLSGVGINNVFDTVTIFSDSLGHFEIRIPAKTKKSIPKPFINRIEKKDYMIMNVVEIDSEDMDIIMCKQETYYSLFNEFKRIGLKNFEATNNHKLNEYRLQKEKKLISHPEYNNYLKAIYDNELAYRKTLNNTSQYFVEIDKSRFDSIVHQCISLILENKIQDAIDLCSNQNYTQQYIEQYEKSKKEYIKRHIDFETNLLRFSSLSDKFEKIGNIYYKLAIYNIESIPILMEYANFLYEQRNFEKAIDWYNQILKRNTSPFITANINNILGSIYFIKEEYSKAEELYYSAIDTYDSIIPKDYYLYSPSKAETLINLAILYKSTRNFNEALSPFNEALEINREFSSIYPDKYLSSYAINLMNLASLHNELRNDSISVDYYLEAIMLFDSLSQFKQDEYKSHKATSLNNLGLIYYKNQKYQEAIEAMNASCTLYEQLSMDYPKQYLLQLTTIKLNLASISKETVDLSKAEKLYLDVIDIYYSLVDINPIENLSQISYTQNLLGLLYSGIGEYEKAQNILKEALRIRKELAEKDIDNNLAKVAEIQNNLGSVFEYTENYNKAIEMYNLSIELYDTLAKNGYYFTEKKKEIEDNIKRLEQLYNKNN